MTTMEKITGKIRAVLRLILVLARFIVHPGDFIRLYHREAVVADSVLDIALINLEREFLERITALEARIAELESRCAADPTE